MTHTPAPWLLLPNNGGVYALDENNEVNRFSARIDGGHVSYTRRQVWFNPTTQEELAANARLIASAPDLLEALSAFVKPLVAHEEKEAAFNAAVAAIARARGESA